MDLKVYREIEDLKKLDKKQLEIEITRINTLLEDIRKQKIIETRPRPFPNIDTDEILKICEEFIDELEECGFDDEDNIGGWFEEILKTVYGKHVMIYIRKNYQR